MSSGASQVSTGCAAKSAGECKRSGFISCHEEMLRECVHACWQRTTCAACISVSVSPLPEDFSHVLDFSVKPAFFGNPYEQPFHRNGILVLDWSMYILKVLDYSEILYYTDQLSFF